ncbi:MAG: Beta-lactamase, partial [Caulobacteraceae bacterium]|nr:Beta-lactamase [Caulobacteraceae bacterium]
MIDRRVVLAAAPLAMTTWSALAETPEAATFKALERRTGGRIGVHAENLDTGTRIAWRADERFVMCSTFKASLAACVLARVDSGREHL